MGAFVVTRPTTEPVSLGDVREHLRIDTADSDSTLARYVVAARQYAENYTRRALMTQTWECTFDYDWPMVGTCYRLDFPFAPVASITSVTYTDAAGATQTLGASQYLLRGTGEDNIPYIVPAYEVTWPEVQWIPEAIRVRFVAGYGSQPSYVPEPVRLAILFHVELLYDRNPQSRELLEATRDRNLDPYRVVRV